MSIYEIAAPVAVDVFPLALGAETAKIFTKWAPGRTTRQEVKRVTRRESGRNRFQESRKTWGLGIECSKELGLQIWNFILAHAGAGKPFYWYDIEQNGWLWDATGVATTGRYRMRLDGSSFTCAMAMGFRLSMDLTLVEVD